jgi:hypothetical protein
MTMADMTSASVTLYVEVLDPQAMWDHAHNAYALAHLDHKIHDEAQPTRLASELLPSSYPSAALANSRTSAIACA